jgi:hypothetical protein
MKKMLKKGYTPIRIINGIEIIHTFDKPFNTSYEFSYRFITVFLDQNIINRYEKVNKFIENAFLLKEGRERRNMIDNIILNFYPLSTNYSWLFEYASQDAKDYIAYIKELESRPFLQDDNAKVLK